MVCYYNFLKQAYYLIRHVAPLFRIISQNTVDNCVHNKTPPKCAKSTRINEEFKDVKKSLLGHPVV